MDKKAKFCIGQSVSYNGRLYKVIAAEVMGVTGWRYELDDGQGHIAHAVWEHELL